MAEICRCGRTRNTEEDLARWRAEEEAGWRADYSEGRKHVDPAWVRALCWSNRPINECNMKKLEPTP